MANWISKPCPLPMVHCVHSLNILLLTFLNSKALHCFAKFRSSRQKSECSKFHSRNGSIKQCSSVNQVLAISFVHICPTKTLDIVNSKLQTELTNFPIGRHSFALLSSCTILGKTRKQNLFIHMLKMNKFISQRLVETAQQIWQYNDKLISKFVYMLNSFLFRIFTFFRMP